MNDTNDVPPTRQVTFRCDGCGLTAPGVFSSHSQAWHKPSHWYQRSDDKGPQLACSRQCIQTASANAGTSPAILPI